MKGLFRLNREWKLFGLNQAVHWWVVTDRNVMCWCSIYKYVVVHWTHVSRFWFELMDNMGRSLNCCMCVGVYTTVNNANVRLLIVCKHSSDLQWVYLYRQTFRIINFSLNWVFWSISRQDKFMAFPDTLTQLYTCTGMLFCKIYKFSRELWIHGHRLQRIIAKTTG